MQKRDLKLPLTLAALIVLSGCSSSSPQVMGTPTVPTPGIHRDQAIEIAGVSRQYDFFMPANTGEEDLPLVFLFHGSRSDTDALTGATLSKAPFAVWMDIAESEKVILVYPQGDTAADGNTGWNDCRSDATSNPTVDDVSFVRELIDTFSAQLAVDTDRVFATGISNGGHMSLRLALELSDRIAAVAAVSAAMPAAGCTTPVNPVSVLFMNGTLDPLLPYDGGEVAAGTAGRGTVLSAQASVDFWVAFNQTSTQPIVRSFDDQNLDDSSTVRSLTYAAGIEDTEVVLYEINGGGHLEPSIQEQYRGFVENSLGAQNHDIEMSTEIWEFFQNKTLD